MPIDYRQYPPNFADLRAAVLARAGHRCEGSPAYPDCRAVNHEPHPVTGSRVVLTTAHLYDNDKATQDITRLRAWCQRCHLFYDLPHHMAKAAQTRNRKRASAGQTALSFFVVPEREGSPEKHAGNREARQLYARVGRRSA